MLARLKAFSSQLIPIERHEWKKFIPLLLIFFFVGFIYNILRNTKDALLITGQSSGAEVIPFVKVWVMLPAALGMTAFFSWLCNKFSLERVFYVLISFFLVFFVIFAFFLYPNREAIHWHSLGNALEKILPQGAAGFISMIRHWSYTLFYVMCEMWSCIVLSLLFWGFANEVTTVKEATRFYGLLGVGMNFSNMAAGQCCIYLSRLPLRLNIPPDPWQNTLIFITIVIAVSGLIICGVFRWLHTNVLADCKHYMPKKKKNYKLSLRKNFSYLAKSKYLISIAIIVLSFNLVINLVEVIWKHQLRLLYPNPNDLSVYLNQVSIWTGFLATSVAVFSSLIIKRFGWTRAAAITPIILLLTSVGFFSCLLFGNSHSNLFSFIGLTPIALAAFLGSLQICLSRACKYTVFDATKELSFIPLTPESRQKGKAAIDGVGSRLGKSGGSVIHQGLLMVFAGFTASAPYVAGFLFFVILIWLGAVKVLGKKFKDLTEHHESLNITDEEEKTVDQPEDVAADSEAPTASAT